MATDRREQVRLPWYPTYPADELTRTLGMTLEEEACYYRLKYVQWIEGFIPADLEALARICKHVPVAKMRKLWQALQTHFEPLDGMPGRLVNPQLETTRQERQAFVNAKSAAGIAGNEKRWAAKSPNTVALGSHSDRTAITDSIANDRYSDSELESEEKKTPIPPSRSRARGVLVESDPGFLEFWEAYPRKESRRSAARAFASLNPDEETRGQILKWLEMARKSEQWQDPTKIPHASTLINQRRWEGDPPPISPAAAQTFRNGQTVVADEPPARELPEPTEALRTAWAQLLDTLDSKIEPSVLRVWIKPLQLCELTAEGEALIQVPNEFFRHWHEENQDRLQLLTDLRVLLPEVKRLTFVSAAQGSYRPLRVAL